MGLRQGAVSLCRMANRLALLFVEDPRSQRAAGDFRFCRDLHCSRNHRCGLIYISRARRLADCHIKVVLIMKIKDTVLASLLSMTLTFGAGFVYVFYPIIAAVFQSMFGNGGTGGFGAVAGGVSNRLLLVLFILEAFVFLIILAWLPARRTAR